MSPSYKTIGEELQNCGWDWACEQVYELATLTSQNPEIPTFFWWIFEDEQPPSLLSVP